MPINTGIVLKSFIIIVLLIATYMTVSFGLANVYFKQVEKQIAAWQKHQKINNTENYKTALTTIDNVLLLHQTPQYLEAKAQILEWGVRENLIANQLENQQETLKKIQALYLESTTLRPTWPGTWAALALNKWHLAEFDQQMIRYLKNAHTFGKNTPEVHVIWATLGKALANSADEGVNQLIEPYLDIVDYHINMGQKHPQAKPYLK